MTYWEFLLQKEGDRSWLPLKTPNLKFEEGKYRLVVNSSRSNTDVEVRVTYHTKTPQGKVVRKSQTRSRRTNAEGLMVVIPYTHLKSGLWEFRCNGDVMADLIGEGWQEKVKLAITPVSNHQPAAIATDKLDSFEEKETITQVTVAETTPQAVLPVIEDNVENQTNQPDNPPVLPIVEQTQTASAETLLANSLSDLQKLLDEQFEPLVSTIEQNEAKPSLTEITPPPEIPNPQIITDSGVTLSLNQDTLIWKRNVGITIAGNITVNPLSRYQHLSISKLRYELRNPQNTALLMAIEQDLIEISLPYQFSYSFLIPEHITSHLILGEVFLEVLTDNSAQFLTLATQNFRLNADVTELLSVVKPLLTEVETESAIETPLKTSKLLKFDEINLQQTIPPKQEPELKPKKSLKFDHFGQRTHFQPTFNRQEARQLPETPVNPPNSDIETTEETVTTIAEISSNLYLFEIKQQNPELSVKPAPGNIIPPKLSHPSPTKEAKLPQLPTFIEKSTPLVATFPLGIPQANSQLNNLAPDTVIDNIESQDKSPELSAVIESGNIAENEDISEENFSESDTEAVISTESALFEQENQFDSVDEAFQALNLKERFWSRLNTLAAESDNFKWNEEESSNNDDNVIVITDEESIDELISTEDDQDNGEMPEIAPEEASSLLAEVEANLAQEIPEIHVATETEMATSLLARADAILIEHESDSDNLDQDSEQSVNILETEENQSESIPETEINSELALTREIEPELPSEIPISYSEEDDDFDAIIDQLLFQNYGNVSDDNSNQEPELEETEQQPEEIESVIEEINPVFEQPVQALGADISSLEIVVDDEEMIPEQPTVPVKYDTSGLPYPDNVIPSRRQDTGEKTELIEVPTPILTINKKELIAGESVVVHAKLPPYPGPVYIKLWLQDRQTRGLLDGPHALVELDYNREGELETITQINVPLGCMEVGFCAIAIDTETQEESHRTLVEKMVIPPNTTEISWEDFDI